MPSVSRSLLIPVLAIVAYISLVEGHLSLRCAKGDLGNLCATNTCDGSGYPVCSTCVGNATGASVTTPGNCTCDTGYYQNSIAHCQMCNPSSFCTSCVNSTHCDLFGCAANADGMPNAADPTTGPCSCLTGTYYYTYGYQCIFKTAPDFTTFVVSTSSIQPNWGPAVGAPDIDYELYWGTSSALASMTRVYNGTTRSFLVSGLVNATTYYFRVVSRDMYTRSQVSGFQAMKTYIICPAGKYAVNKTGPCDVCGPDKVPNAAQDACTSCGQNQYANSGDVSCQCQTGASLCDAGECNGCKFPPAEFKFLGLSTGQVAGAAVGVVLFVVLVIVAFALMVRHYKKEKKKREEDLARRRAALAGVPSPQDAIQDVTASAKLGDVKLQPVTAGHDDNFM